MIINHTPIVLKTICKNGSEKLGGNASCKFKIDNSPIERFVEVEQFAPTTKEAAERLINFLSGNGQYQLKEIQEDKP